ncbi:bifunctional DNA primase/polymerase, partial [Kribbella solani]
MAKRTTVTHLLEERLEVPAFQRSVLIREAISIAEKTGAGIVPLVDKVARQKGWQNNAAKTPSEIKEALSPLWVNGAGVLLPDGYCVVDTDTEDAEIWACRNLPKTLTVKTKKGYHRYYSTSGPIRQDRSGIHPGVDVLSRRNYAVYVGSVHPDTGQVEYHHENPYASITDLPEWLYERLRDTGEGMRPEKTRERAREASTVSVDVSQGAAKNAEEVIDYLKHSRPNTLDNLNDLGDGRDKRVYQVVLSLLQSGCGGLDDVLAVLVQFPLWQKVSEQRDVMAYLAHKVESAQNFIAENPAEMTVLHWRRRVSGAVLKPGLMKVLEAIGYEAHRLTQKTGNDATRLTLSSRQVALGSAMGKSPAARWMRTAEGERWIKKVSDPGKSSGYAPVYLLTVPRSAVA